MRRSIELVRKALKFQNPERLPRGELWINSRIFQRAQLTDNLDGHLRLRNRLSMDLLFLPLSATETYNLCQGYRYFSIKDIQKAVKLSNLFVVVIIDGPFQKLVNKEGLITVLGNWKRDKKGFMQKYRQETEKIRKLIHECLGIEVQAFVMADDLAYEHSTYFSPDDAKNLLVPFYNEIVESIHSGGAYALFHSCGNIKALIPQLISCGIDGFAACQSGSLDFISLKKTLQSNKVFLTGIEPYHLESQTLSEEHQRQFCNFVQEMAKGGGFILCSSCGLYKLEFIDRIQVLYDLVEKKVEEPGQACKE